MKTVLITGGAGFIGSNFVHYIMDKYPEYKILILDALTYAGSVDNLPQILMGNTSDRGEFLYGNITNANLVDTLVSRSNIIVHFAAETHVTRSIYDNTLFFHTDVLGTQTIANAVCKYKNNIERFIHISTSEVYGTALKKAMDENHPLNPGSPYAAAKVGADRLVYSYWHTYEIPAIIVRPFNNYGPRQHLEKVIPRFITSSMLNEPMRIHGDGSAKRDFVYVEDVCRALDLIMHADLDKVVGEVFNIGSGKDISIGDIAKDITKIMQSGSSTTIVDRPGQVVRHTADINKIKKILGWKPEVSWIDGLKKTISWYNANRNVWEKQMWLREIPIVTADGVKACH